MGARQTDDFDHGRGVNPGEGTTSRRGRDAVTLTAAEMRVLRYFPSHYTQREIARELYIAHSTVKSHSLAVYRKLGVNSRAQAVERAVDLGLLPARFGASATDQPERS